MFLIRPVHWIVVLGYVLLASIVIHRSMLPFKAELMYKRALLHEVRGHYNDAIKNYLKSIELFPFEPRYFSNLASVYMKYAKTISDKPSQYRLFMKAEDVFMKAVLLDEFNPWYQIRLSFLYEALMDVFPSEKVIWLKKRELVSKQASILDRNNPLFQMHYAVFLHSENRFKEAIAYYKRVMDMDASILDAPFNMANAYVLLDDANEGLKYYLDVYQKDPTFNHVRVLIAKVYLDYNYPKEAIFYLKEEVRYLQTALEDDTNLDYFSKALHLLRYAYLSYGDSFIEEGLSFFESLEAQMPYHKILHPVYIDMLIDVGSLKKAKRKLEIMLKKYPNYEKIKEQYGEIIKKLGSNL